MSGMCSSGYKVEASYVSMKRKVEAIILLSRHVDVRQCRRYV